MTTSTLPLPHLEQPEGHPCPHCDFIAVDTRGLGQHTRSAHTTVDNDRIWDTPIPGPWVADALCAQIGDDPFFPDGQGSPARIARGICATCPVQPECLEFALDHSLLQGIWGGTTPSERRDLRKTRGTAA